MSTAALVVPYYAIHTCGHCSKIVVRPMRCSRCLCRSYCDAVCQKKDWKIHKEGCNNYPELHGPAFHTLRSYDFKFFDGFLSFALTYLDLWGRYHHLGQEDFLREWSGVTCLYFLHVHVVRVDNPPPGRCNHVQFHSVRMSSLYVLQPSLRESIQKRLEERAPAFTIGYSVVSGGEFIHRKAEQVEAFVHTFRYPLWDTSNIDCQDILMGIACRESLYRVQAAQKARDGHKK
ncbi:hypothetical protein CVT26_015453 [Gymnopilus dilepis]|uniref:MYND-type domain-containing protein n=1 Tax=Gymnopilus dilepis TaxID=231916 RepID=A0A409W4E1_9AGAR|nr:hypothetical protein CVT26_015453 [Gymnopilus dilepis]